MAFYGKDTGGDDRWVAKILVGPVPAVNSNPVHNPSLKN